MKKSIYITMLSFAIFSCESSTYEDLEEPTIIVGEATYVGNAKAIIDANCISCHSPGGVSSFRPLTTYLEVKEAIQTTNLLNRIQRQNGEPGQMPQTGRMSQDKINIILQWNADGLLEN